MGLNRGIFVKKPKFERPFSWQDHQIGCTFRVGQNELFRSA